MLHFNYTCGNALFFENTACLQCGSEVGYEPAKNSMRPTGENFTRCRNGAEILRAAARWNPQSAV